MERNEARKEKGLLCHPKLFGFHPAAMGNHKGFKVEE